MAKRAYIGVDGKARKVKNMYVGVNTEFPVYTETSNTITFKSFEDVNKVFTISNNTYYFNDAGILKNGYFTSTNDDYDSTTAQSTWTAKYDISNISFNYEVSSEANYDKFTIVVAGTTIVNAISGSQTGSWSGSMNTGQSIVLSYSKDSSDYAGGDYGRIYNVTVTYKTKTQSGTTTKAVARRIKKAYIGVGGKARLCWSLSSVDYNGTITSSMPARWYYGAASTTSHALFAGGEYGRWYEYEEYEDEYDRWSYSGVYAYNSNLTESTPASLYSSRHGMGTASLGGCAFFCGGWQVGYGVVRYIEKYDDNLVNKGRVDDYSYRWRYGITTLNDKILIVGGEDDDGYSCGDALALDINLTKAPLNGFEYSWSGGASVTVGNYAIFGAGTFSTEMTSGYWNYIFAYDTNLSLHELTNVNPDGRYWDAKSAASVGNYGVFEQGGCGFRPIAIDKNLTTQALTKTGYQDRSAAISSPESALFFGGEGSSTESINTVYKYDSSLSRETITPLSVRRAGLGAATVANYILISNGYTSSYLAAEEAAPLAMDVYVIS